MLANTLREELQEAYAKQDTGTKDSRAGVMKISDKISDEMSNINVASWFMMDKDQKADGDILLKEEDDWIRLIKESDYDVIIADPLLKKAVPFFEGEWYDLPHFAISGKKRQTV